MAPRGTPANGMDEAAAPIDHNAGHRERARERFMAVGGETLQDYELLELLLFPLIPRRDTKAVAKDLIARFGSLSGVLGAEPARLGEIAYVGETVVAGLKAIHATAQRFAKQKIDHNQPILSSWSALIDYCRAAMAYEGIEQFRILFLDKKNRLMLDEVQQTGTVDHTPVYPREVMKRALELGATAIILVHNHPSGDPSPSAADVQMTRQINDIAKPLGITLHDHIIIGRNGHVSMRAQKLI